MDVAVFTTVQLQLLLLQFTVMLCLDKLIFSVKFSHSAQSCRLTSSSQMGKLVYILDPKLHFKMKKQYVDFIRRNTTTLAAFTLQINRTYPGKLTQQLSGLLKTKSTSVLNPKDTPLLHFKKQILAASMCH